MGGIPGPASFALAKAYRALSGGGRPKWAHKGSIKDPRPAF